MERESNPMQALCRSGCGFYGSPATDGLCSLCYKEALKKKQQLPSTPTSLSALRDTATAQTTISHISSSPVSDLPIQRTSKICQNSSMSKNHLPTTDTDTSSNEEEEENNDETRKEDVRSCSSKYSPDRVDPDPGFTAVVVDEGAASGIVNAQSTTDVSGGPTTVTGITEISAAVLSTANPPTDLDHSSSDDKDADKDAKKKKNRCATCRKKVGLTGFECRCGGLFCAIHRYSDKHDCSFNYREMGAQEIRRNNPVVVGEKIQKI